MKKARALAAAGALSLGTALAAAMPAAASATASPGPLPAGVSMLPCGVRSSGTELYISAGFWAYRVNEDSGQLAPVAGTGSSYVGQPGSNIPAVTASLMNTCGMAADPAGNLLLADDSYIRVIAKASSFYNQIVAGNIYTLGSISYPYLSFTFRDAVDVSSDQAGNVIAASEGSESSHTDQEYDSIVYLIAEQTGTFYGQRVTRGKMYAVAGNLDDYTPGNKVPAVSADLGDTIGSVRLDSSGNLVIAESGSNGQGGPQQQGPAVYPAIRVVPDKTGTYYGQLMKAGYIYTIAGGLKGSPAGNGTPAVKSPLSSAMSVAMDHAGNVVIADDTRVRVIAKSTGTFYGQKMKAGDIYAIAGSGTGTFSGNGGLATRAVFTADEVSVDNAGNVLVADSPDCRVLAIAPRTGTFYGMKMLAGHLYSVAGNGRAPLVP